MNSMPLKSQPGFTIIELMVAMAIGLIVSAAVAALFIQSKSSYIQNDAIGIMQENGRYALKVLADDLVMVDYWGGIQSPPSITTDTVDIDSDGTNDIAANIDQTDVGCGPSGVANWNYTFTTTLSHMDETNTTAVAAVYSCVGTIKSDTDVLLIKRVKGLPFTSENNLTNGLPYVRTNQVLGTVFRHKDTVTLDPPSGYQDWQYLAHIYYIEDDQFKRQALRAGETPSTDDPEFVEEVLADGIEQFNILYGIDGDSDGIAEFFTSTPTDVQIATAVVARIYVLARSTAQITGYTNAKSYVLGDETVAAANDGYYRRVFSTSVVMRNPLAIQVMN